ncbi:NADP-dependent 3-hydroxy acid dehydrogenase YdfG [Elusimicrobium simillimum]|uniref:SDR family oxidoreductase n=1 Tax=Elusimicrobium simillimum TaxID=3143438 RepID=UPI003C701EBF
MGNIKGKVVIITGASSGLGEVTAKKLAAEGATLVLAARREDRLNAIVNDIEAKGGKASYYVVNVTNKEELKNMVDSAAKRYGKVDVMVNNAGIMPAAPLSLLKTDEWDNMIDVNIKGLLYGVAAVLPLFEAQGKGHIINIASIAGLKVAPGNVVYCATKHAVRAISEGIRMEYLGKIRSTIVSPGYTESELKYCSSDPATKEATIAGYAEHEIPGTTVADAIAYAISQPDNTSISEIVIRPTTQEF